MDLKTLKTHPMEQPLPTVLPTDFLSDGSLKFDSNPFSNDRRNLEGHLCKRIQPDFANPYFCISSSMNKSNKEYVILVNSSGRKTGVMEKIEAHKRGHLHRAFSIFIFNDDGKLLLQKRALSKYHFAGLWSNTCCSHPRPGENTLKAAKRRLKEELGFITKLEVTGHFTYRHKDNTSGLIEHEFDYVITGLYNGKIDPDPAEVALTKWVKTTELISEIRSYPHRFTPWFKLICEKPPFEHYLKTFTKV